MIPIGAVEAISDSGVPTLAGERLKRGLSLTERRTRSQIAVSEGDDRTFFAVANKTVFTADPEALGEPVAELITGIGNTLGGPRLRRHRRSCRHSSIGGQVCGLRTVAAEEVRRAKFQMTGTILPQRADQERQVNVLGLIVIGSALLIARVVKAASRVHYAGPNLKAAIHVFAILAPERTVRHGAQVAVVALETKHRTFGEIQIGAVHCTFIAALPFEFTKSEVHVRNDIFTSHVGILQQARRRSRGDRTLITANQSARDGGAGAG